MWYIGYHVVKDTPQTQARQAMAGGARTRVEAVTGLAARALLPANSGRLHSDMGAQLGAAFPAKSRCRTMRLEGGWALTAELWPVRPT